MEEKVRIDKFLWSVRLFKTRTDAAAACSKGQVLINETVAKASKKVEVGNIISVKNIVVYRKYKILELLKKRVGAKLVENYISEITSEDDLFKLKMYYEMKKNNFKKQKPGRPTKKDRRDLDKFLDN